MTGITNWLLTKLFVSWSIWIFPPKQNKETKQNYTTLRTKLNYSIFFLFMSVSLYLFLSLYMAYCLSVSLSVSVCLSKVIELPCVSLFLSLSLVSLSISLYLLLSLCISVAYLSFESWCAILNAWIAWNLLNKLKFDKQ